jgi:hypothetical protein
MKTHSDLPGYVRLSLKFTNSLAYYDPELITTVKIFMVQAPASFPQGLDSLAYYDAEFNYDLKKFMVQVPASFPQGLGWQIETQDGGGGRGHFTSTLFVLQLIWAIKLKVF